MSPSGWESNEVEHTFESGRTMVIRRGLSMQWLVLRSIEDGDAELATGLSEWFEKGTLDGAADPTPESRMRQLQVAAKVERAVVEAMFIRPRVYWDPEMLPAGGGAPDGEIPHHILAGDLRDSELSEILELAFKGVAEASRFREGADGPDDRPDGKGVGAKPKPRARAASRKH